MSIQQITSIFIDQWQAYQWAVEQNVMGHEQLIEIASGLINKQFQHRPMIMADLGCGDSRFIPALTQAINLEHYYGIDLAENALNLSSQWLESNDITSRQFSHDLFTGLPETPFPPNFIYSAFAIHHGDTSQKRQLMQALQQQTDKGTLFLLIDILLHPEQTRIEYCEMLEQHFEEQHCRSDWLVTIMQHVYEFDYPETIGSWQNIATSSGWQVLHQQSLNKFDKYPVLVMLLQR